MKILLADINEAIIESVRFAIKSCQSDWQVKTIDSGKQCLSIVNNGGCPDAIILGMQLRDISGLDLIKQIREDSDLPVIMLSNSNNLHALVKAFDSGVNDYMVEPININILIARLKALTRRRR